MRLPRNWLAIASITLLLYSIATVVSIATILLLVRDAEAIGLGLLIPLFALPAIGLYVIAAASQLPSPVRHAVFWLFLLPFPLGMLVVALFPSPGAAEDAADQWAMAISVPLLAAGTCAYLVDQVGHFSRRCS